MFHRSLLATILAALHIFSVTVAAASTGGPAGCVTFDVDWNLLAFGFNSKDYNVGTQDKWSAAGPPTDITTSGRPPFNSVNTTCYLSQYENAIYVLNADIANPSSIHIYDVSARSWSMQKVITHTSTSTFDPSNFAAILDHDTNVFYAYSGGHIFFLDMASLKSASSAAIPWQDAQEADLSPDPSDATPGANTAGYQPVIALAQNHVHFLGIPGFSPGSAKIFVIHYSFMQPTPQSYGNFPTTYGRTASFFHEEGVQEEFAFIPDDGSATYVINVQTNTTKTLTGPRVKDAFATYSASTSALVQLSTSGKVSFLAYNPTTTTSGGSWAHISQLPQVAFTSKYKSH